MSPVSQNLKLGNQNFRKSLNVISRNLSFLLLLQDDFSFLCWMCSFCVHLTTIPVVVGVSTEFEILKLRTCSIYHENLLLQKFKDIIQVLKYFFFSLWHHGGCQRLFPFLWHDGCVIQESYCFAVGIGQQAQWNSF